MISRSLLNLTAAAILALGTGAALPAAAQPRVDGLPGDVCVHIVGLMAGERHYGACVESLRASQSNLGDAERNARARRDCLSRGMQPNTPALAECVLTTAGAEPGVQGGPGADVPIPGGARSYFVVSRETAIERDKLACARLGFDPTQEAFGDCVADLRSALARASSPSN